MAEIVYKRISDLDSATQPLSGAELSEVSQGGVSKKVSLTNIFGSGWWAMLRAAFADFVAPNATHAVDSDTVGGEYPADLHDATALTGAVPLDSIPANLAGRSVSYATSSGMVNGINFSTGKFGNISVQEGVTAGYIWIIPQGTYNIQSTAPCYFQMKNQYGVFIDTGVSFFPGGLVVSDGSSFRLKAAGSGMIVYDKLA